jgi:uncharacterized protein (TIGR02145 family)
LLNDDCSWSPSINLGSAWKDTCRVNIERIIEHEIGHNLGLNDLSESDPFSTNSIMGEANVTIPLSICAFDLENLRKEYPEINANTDFQTVFGIEIINPEESTMTCSARQIFTDFFKVKVIDKFGDAVPEVTVVFNLVNRQNNNSLYIEQPAVTTDQNGIATLKSLVLPDIVGTFTLSAKSWTEGEVMASPKESIFQITTISADESKTTDIDGNIYKTVNIGTQTWIAENLKTTKFNDGSVILLVTESFKWAALMTLKTPGYCWYNYDADMYNSPYGALYNYFALDVATNGGKNVCPTGWHVPTDTQWTILTTYLGGESVAGSKLKETGTTHWQNQNTDATNETGFTALPGGNCGYDGTFWAFGVYGEWWSSTEAGVNGAWYRRMDYSDRGVFRDYYYKHFGFSVRCIKDN